MAKIDYNELAQRRIKEMLVETLEKAKNNGGIWLNESRRCAAPRIFGKPYQMSGFNQLVLLMNSEKKGFDTNFYTNLPQTNRRGEHIIQGEKGVPFYWYNWEKYSHRQNPNDIISREEYQKLPAEQKPEYKGIKQREVKVFFNVQQTSLPENQKDVYDTMKKLMGRQDLRGDTEATYERNLHPTIKQLREDCTKYLLPIRRDVSGVGHYNASRDAVYLPAQKHYQNYFDYVRDLLRKIAMSTGHTERMARNGFDPGNGNAPKQDRMQYEQLVTELSAGIMGADYGVQAKFSPESMKMVDDWIREVKENPEILDQLEMDVNNVIDAVAKVQRQTQVELNKNIHEKQTDKYIGESPKNYHIADMLQNVPDRKSKHFILVMDRDNKSVDVVLPSGASLATNNEIQGMNKKLITNALLKNDGVEHVRFYNTGGSLGYRPSDDEFKGKAVAECKMKNRSLEVLSRYDISDAVERATLRDFDKVHVLDSEEKPGMYMIYIEPKEEKAIALYLDRQDQNQFFEVAQKGSEAQLNRLRHELGNKYYFAAKRDPSLIQDIESTKVPGADLNMIDRVNVFKQKNTNGEMRMMCLPIFKNGIKVQPRPITQLQWQKLFVVQDKENYKKNLAATLYAEIVSRQHKEYETAHKQLTEVLYEEKPSRSILEEIADKVNGNRMSLNAAGKALLAAGIVSVAPKVMEIIETLRPHLTPEKLANFGLKAEVQPVQQPEEKKEPIQQNAATVQTPETRKAETPSVSAKEEPHFAMDETVQNVVKTNLTAKSVTEYLTEQKDLNDGAVMVYKEADHYTFYGEDARTAAMSLQRDTSTRLFQTGNTEESIETLDVVDRQAVISMKLPDGLSLKIQETPLLYGQQENTDRTAALDGEQSVTPQSEEQEEQISSSYRR